MGSSSSSTAAAAAAQGSNNPNNPYHQHAYHHHQAQQGYFSRGELAERGRYDYEYCGGGGGYGYSSGQQQGSQMQSSGSNRDLFHAPGSSSSHHQQQQQQPSSSKHEKKKRSWWKRRNSRSTDPGQPLRELLGTWSLGEVVALVHEYETMTNEKELYIHAESARPRAPTLRSDLADLLDFKWNSDVNLVLPPAIFPAHRAILSQRSKYFRNLLNSSVNNPSVQSCSNNGIVNVNVEDTSVDIPTFSSLLRYLYTEEVPSSSVERSEHHHGQQSCTGGGGNGGGGGSGGGRGSEQHNYHALGTIIRPSKPLESDLRDLLQTGKYSDIVLVLGDEQFAVHKPILAARSPFFRSLLQRRSNSKKIVLDDTVIPKRYARVILNCMYTDKLDLSLIEPCRSGLSEVESLTFTGKVNPSGFEEAMELYQIGRFLEFDHLCVTSEDIITESLTHDSLPQILRWSSQSHGSSWVRRQAIMYVQEEYASLISTPSFLDLDKSTLLEVVQSDFLQASEVEVLNSIVKWGEHQLIKRVEDREPNLVSSTRDSVFRNERGKDRGKRGRNDKVHAYASDMHLNDGELREIVFELIRCVRVDHIGLSNEFLVGAVRRGLVSIPPTHMITEEKVNPWVNNLQCPNYIRPRLYTPYYEEAKSALRQRTGNTSGGGATSSECLGGLQYTSHSSNLAYLNSIGRIKTLRPIIPDTLYMIDNSDGGAPEVRSSSSGTATDKHYGQHHHHHHHHHHHSHERFDESSDREKNADKSDGGGGGISGTSRGDDDKEGVEGIHHLKEGSVSGGGKDERVEEMVVDQELLNAMLYREKKLRSAHLRNLSNPISRERATRYIRLRVVREFGYPDYVAELLDHHNRASLNNALPSSTTTTPASINLQQPQQSTITSSTTSSTNTPKQHDSTSTSSSTKLQPENQPNQITMLHHHQQQQSSSSSSSLSHPPPPDCTASTSSSSHHHHNNTLSNSPLHSSISSYNPPPPPPEFHTNMPDVAMNTNTTSAADTQQVSQQQTQQQQQVQQHVQQQHQHHHHQVPESMLIPFLDLDLGDNNSSALLGGERTGLVRSRNRSFGSLSSRNSSGTGVVCSSTQSLASRIGSSSGNLHAANQHHHGSSQQQQQAHHHHQQQQQFLVAAPTSSAASGAASGGGVIGYSQQQQQHHSSSSSAAAAAAANAHMHHYAAAVAAQQQRTSLYNNSLQYAQVYSQQHPHHHSHHHHNNPHSQSIYSTTSRPTSSTHHHNAPHSTSTSSYAIPPPQCSTYSQSLHRLDAHVHVPPQQSSSSTSTLLRSNNPHSSHSNATSLQQQMKSSGNNNSHNNTPPSHYL